MAQNSGIEWTTHTGNLWIGCQETTNPGCDNCYARTWDQRYYGSHLGANAPRRAVKSLWQNLKKWNKQASEAGRIDKVFVGSLMDIFERSRPLVDHNDVPLEIETEHLRSQFFDAVDKGTYPNLIFQLLTKRPSNVTRMVPKKWLTEWPENVWLGTSIADQETADKYIPLLLQVPCQIRFLSIEPLIGPVLLDDSNNSWLTCDGHELVDGHCCESQAVLGECFHGIDWVIVGGESGLNARPMHPDWVRSLRDQCVTARVPFFFKQWGEWIPTQRNGHWCQDYIVPGKRNTQITLQGDFCNDMGPQGMATVAKVGKKKAGRELDGRTWNEFPDTHTKLHKVLELHRATDEYSHFKIDKALKEQS